MKNLIKAIYQKTFKALKIHRLFGFYAGVGTILMFHRIVRPEDKSEFSRHLEVSPEYLETIIGHYRDRGYEFACLDNIPACLGKGRKFICFTFDDGYVDNYTLAYPVFKKHNIPFAVYITTGLPDRTAVLWWYIVEDLVKSRPGISFVHARHEYSYTCKTQGQRQAAFESIKQLIMQATGSKRTELLGRIMSAYNINPADYCDALAMTWEQISTMASDELVTIGAHTASHPVLSLLGAKDSEQEISGSKRVIEARIGRQVSHFAFPFGYKGDFGEREVDFVREQGFVTATTTLTGNLFSGHAGFMHSLPRIGVDGALEDLGVLELKTSGFEPALRNGFRRVVTYV